MSKDILSNKMILVGIDFPNSNISKNIGLTVLLIGDKAYLLHGYREESTSIKKLMQDPELFLEKSRPLQEYPHLPLRHSWLNNIRHL